MCNLLQLCDTVVLGALFHHGQRELSTISPSWAAPSMDLFWRKLSTFLIIHPFLVSESMLETYRRAERKIRLLWDKSKTPPHPNKCAYNYTHSSALSQYEVWHDVRMFYFPPDTKTGIFICSWSCCVLFRWFAMMQLLLLSYTRRTIDARNNP